MRVWTPHTYLRNYLAQDSGQVAVFFALLAVPLIAVTTAAVDYTNVIREKDAVTSALDAAVIAAVNNNAIKLSEKPAFAETHFRANYSGDVTLKLTSGVDESRVRLLAQGEVPLTFGNSIGIKNPPIQDASAAEISSENTICVLALSKADEGAVRFAGDMIYNSENCTVHTNSRHPRALASLSSKKPEAKSFCAVGGAVGKFEPYAKGECKVIADPYAGTPTPLIPETCAVEKDQLIRVKPGLGPNKTPPGRVKAPSGLAATAASVVAEVVDVNDLPGRRVGWFVNGLLGLVDSETGKVIKISENLTGGDVDLLPGTYCGGLTIDGENVNFAPGEYIIKDGPLSFINGAVATAKGVTFILAGQNTAFNVQSGAAVDFKAPRIGPRRGLSVMEVVETNVPGNREVIHEPSRISGGGRLTVTGTVYLPTHALEISGRDTNVGSLAPATSFIAHTVSIEGQKKARMTIDIDHQSAGIPSILPRAEDGARLVE